MKPPVFVIEDDFESFAVDGPTGWTALIAGYVRFPEPRQWTDGWPVLEPKPPESVASLRPLMAHAILESP